MTTNAHDHWARVKTTKGLRAMVRGYLLTATRKEIEREREIALELRDAERAGYITEMLDEMDRAGVASFGDLPAFPEREV
jgi:ribosomal protein S17E